MCLEGYVKYYEPYVKKDGEYVCQNFHYKLPGSCPSPIATWGPITGFSQEDKDFVKTDVPHFHSTDRLFQTFHDPHPVTTQCPIELDNGVRYNTRSQRAQAWGEAGAGGAGERDETCPVSTEGWTRRVHFVREGGGGGYKNM